MEINSNLEPNKSDFEELDEVWKNEILEFKLSLEIKNRSPHTIKAYIADLIQFGIFCKKEEINFLEPIHTDVRTYLASRSIDKKNLSNKLEKNSLSRKLSSLKKFYEYRYVMDRIPENPIQRISFPKTKKKTVKNLNPVETTTVLEFQGTKDKTLEIRDKAIVELLYSTGARVSEIVNAKLKNLSSDYKELKVLGKRSKERIVYLGTEAVEYLKEYLSLRLESTHEEIFLNHNGSPITERGIFYALDERRKQMGFSKKLNPHKFRHTFASDLLNEGADIRYVQELLGHKNLKTTSIYLSITQERLKEIYRKAHPHGKIKN
ncbi:MAG: tyrosine-type recombinase/integrase [Leptospiraceae bacterium]|nr:tyrosine-type recombinase/integrase [Leptospiraceae bacterium]